MRILFWAAVATESFSVFRPGVAVCCWLVALRTEGGPRAPGPAFVGRIGRLRARWAGRPRAELVDDLGDHARADGAAALADGEAQTGVHGDGLDQLDVHLDVVPRHHHLRALGQVG